ncbi:unnamed protein product, partial [marine sediment metagenome]
FHIMKAMIGGDAKNKVTPGRLTNEVSPEPSPTRLNSR